MPPLLSIGAEVEDLQLKRLAAVKHAREGRGGQPALDALRSDAAQARST